jgi:hypothetical protein
MVGVDPSKHLCGKAHMCREKCASQGVCQIRTELKQEKRVFIGQRDEFEYDLMTQQRNEKLPCTIAIPTGEMTHTGPHIHSETEGLVHQCGTPCPSCGYLCTLEHGHDGVHDTPHGNMRHTNFVSNEENVDVGNHKYVRSESGIAELCKHVSFWSRDVCSFFCLRCGRGHLHLSHCNDMEHCGNRLNDSIRHAPKGFYNNDDLDEVKHDYYWKQLGFRDPQSEDPEVLEQFHQCPCECGSDAHAPKEGERHEPVYCVGKLWHQAYATLPPKMTKGCISERGHCFPCDHKAESNPPCQTFMIIDRSSSMGSTSIRPNLPIICNHGWFINGWFNQLNNVLGCVYEAAQHYILTRLSKSKSDTLTFVPFDKSAFVEFQNKPLSPTLVKRMLHIKPGYGTYFSKGLEAAFDAYTAMKVADQLLSKGRIVFILFTDGQNQDEAETLDTVRRIKQQAPNIVVHTVGFGPSVLRDVLDDIAEIGEGRYFKANDEIELSEAFVAIAEKPGKTVALVANQQ